jgi:hypothetical protein
MMRADKQRQKEMLRQWKEDQRAAARAELPLPDEQLQALFDALDRKLAIRGCDHSRRLTRSFLEQRGLPVDEVFSWLDEHGGYCDCEVLFNVAEHWERCRGDA